jgi:hypothetical protein
MCSGVCVDRFGSSQGRSDAAAPRRLPVHVIVRLPVASSACRQQLLSSLEMRDCGRFVPVLARMTTVIGRLPCKLYPTSLSEI